MGKAPKAGPSKESSKGPSGRKGFGNGQYRCDAILEDGSQCQEEFDTYKQLASHRRKHAPKKQCPYDGCSYSNARQDAVDSHFKRKHEKERPHTCEEKDENAKNCGQRFSTNQHLERHKTSVHKKVKTFECDECDMTFARADEVPMHKRTVHEKVVKAACPRCWVPFPTNADCEKHYGTKHLGIPYRQYSTRREEIREAMKNGVYHENLEVDEDEENEENEQQKKKKKKKTKKQS